MEGIDNRVLFSSQRIKNTKQRNLILDILKQSELPVTAEHIYLKLKSMGSLINLSTVYRILEMFISKGIVLKLSISDDNKAMFELNRMEHRHNLICVCCKKVIPVDGFPLEVYEKSLEERTHFDITGHKLEFFGYCHACKSKEVSINKERA